MNRPLGRMREIFDNEGWTGVLAAINRFRYYHLLNVSTPLSHVFYRPEQPACNPLDEPWDCCIILDACRYDLYAETVNEAVDYRYSPASSTSEFLSAIASGARGDTVYVTGNPMWYKRDVDGYFFDVIDVWRHDWDDEWETVRPEAMARWTEAAYRAYPDKRVLAHWVQPHYPFLTADIGEQAGLTPARKKAKGIVTDVEAHRKPTAWDYLKTGAVSFEQTWQWYRENLELALAEVKALTERIEGRLVITSDHGNMVGERCHPLLGRRVYGHPGEIAHEKLRKVPWHVVKDTRRRQVGQADETAERDVAAETVDERLHALGYAT